MEAIQELRAVLAEIERHNADQEKEWDAADGRQRKFIQARQGGLEFAENVIRNRIAELEK